MWSQFTNVTDRQTERQTDRQTTCDRNTALCTKVHRAVKTVTHMPCYTYNIMLKLFIFWIKYNGLGTVRSTIKLIEGGHSLWSSGLGLYVFISTFFQNPKSRDFLRFCRVSYVLSNYDSLHSQAVAEDENWLHADKQEMNVFMRYNFLFTELKDCSISHIHWVGKPVVSRHPRACAVLCVSRLHCTVAMLSEFTSTPDPSQFQLTASRDPDLLARFHANWLIITSTIIIVL